VSSEQVAERRRARYEPPAHWRTCSVAELNGGARGVERQQLLRLGGADAPIGGRSPDLFVAGRTDLLHRRAVAIVGSRKASDEGGRRAYQLARDLSKAGVVVVSGLALGIDSAALRGALDAGGAVAAVIGTPLDRAYPAENKRLQEVIYRDHLLISQFAHGSRVYPSNFPERNRLMAALTDATVIIEASDTSGSLHQARECELIGKWLFIAKSVVDDVRLTWPKAFMRYRRSRVMTSAQNVLDAIGS